MLAEFTATMERVESKGGWTYVVWPESQAFFGTRGLVKVHASVDGHKFQSSFMAMGNGRQMLPIAAPVRKAIGKEAGDTVRVQILDRR